MLAAKKRSAHAQDLCDLTKLLFVVEGGEGVRSAHILMCSLCVSWGAQLLRKLRWDEAI